MTSKVIYKHQYLDKDDGYLPNKSYFIQDDFYVSNESERFHQTTSYGYFDDGTRKVFGTNKRINKASYYGEFLDLVQHRVGKTSSN